MTDNSGQRQRLGEVASVFLRLGFTAFGGPATALAMMRQEVVLKRKWLTEDEFLDFWGISNLVPGPNATDWRSTLATVMQAGQDWFWQAFVTSSRLWRLSWGWPGLMSSMAACRH